MLQDSTKALLIRLGEGCIEKDATSWILWPNQGARDNSSREGSENFLSNILSKLTS
jgi:hypothetical protein